MAKIGKITIFVEKGVNTQTIRVRTTGQRGTVLLNDVSADVTSASQSPTTTSVLFWQDVLAKAIAAI